MARPPLNRFASSVAVLGLLMTLTAVWPAAASSKSAGLRLSTHSAVPGQVVAVTGKAITHARARVTVGGKRAQIVSRKRRRLNVLLPSLRAGNFKIVVRTHGKTLKARLRVGHGFDGRVKPTLEPQNASSVQIGPGGGSVSADGSDGTTYKLTVPPGALEVAATVTLTPVARLDGLPFSAGRALAVQFSPEGLGFAEPATLRISPESPLAGAIGLAYSGGGRKLGLRRAAQAGGALVLKIDHFSGAGAARMSEQDFERLVAGLAAGPMTLAAAAEFFSALRAVPADWCDGVSHPTCAYVQSEAEGLLGTLTPDDCSTAADGGLVQPMVRSIAILLELESNLQLEGRSPRPVLKACRAKLTAAMVNLIKDTAQSDPLGISGPCAGVVPARADYDNDGKIRDVECALFVAGLAADQDFDILKGIAIDAATAGLQKVLDDGKAKCDAKDFPGGQDLLHKGLAIAAPAQIFAEEFTDALLDCVPKITVSPKNPSVEIDKTQDFTVTSDDPADTSVSWVASGGQINSAGHFTAPHKPGTVTVTATSTVHPDREGSTTVTVTCPAGMFEFNGTCATISVDIDPTAVALDPGASRRFTATVHNAVDTRVSWTETGPGTITQPSQTDAGGLYTAPQAAGTYTVTASSVRDPTKSAMATVTVGGPHVNLLDRHDDLDLTSSVGCDVPGSGFDTDHDEGPVGADFSGPLQLSTSTSATASCGTTSGTASSSSNLVAAGSGGTAFTVAVNASGSTSQSSGGLLGTGARYTFLGDFEAIDDSAQLSCSGTVGSNTTVGIVLDVIGETGRTDIAARSTPGALTGSTSVPADGKSRSLLIAATLGASGSATLSVSCGFDRPSVIVPD